jgi:hypothetical protein
MTEGPTYAEEFLSAELPPAVHPLFPAALRRAYASADHVMETSSFLLTPGGKFQRGDLIACAAEYEVQKLIQTGQLQGLDFSWEDYAKPTGKHLVVHTPRGKLTISQVADAAKPPRHADFRTMYQVTNAPFLFENMNTEAEADASKKHILLVHGYKTLEFAHFTLPHRMRDAPIYRTGNLLNLPSVIHDVVQAEGPSESPEPEAVEHLIRLVHDADKS